MAVNDPTTNFGWDLPLVGGDLDAWGTILNQDFGDVLGVVKSIDEVLFELQGRITTVETDVTNITTRTETLEAGGNQPFYARTYLTADENIPNGVGTAVAWDAVSFDKGGFWSSGSPTRLTVPAGGGGIYGIRAVVRVPSWAGPGENDARSWDAHIKKNGAILTAFARKNFEADGHDENSGDRTLVLETLDSLLVGDFLELFLETNLGTSGIGDPSGFARLGQTETYFELVRYPSAPTGVPVQFSQTLMPGRWYRPGALDVKVGTTVIAQGGEIYYRPFQVNRSVTIDQAAFELVANSPDNYVVRFAVYEAGTAGNFLPDKRLQESNDLVLTAPVAGTYTHALPVNLKAGTLYWLAFAARRTAGTAGLTVQGHEQGGDHVIHFGHETASDAVGTPNPRSLLKATIGEAWVSLPDPADLTGKIFQDVAQIAVALRVK